MNIQKINLSPNFGIRCIKPEAWNKEVLHKIETSALIKEIDEKYPDAHANYFHFKHNDLANDEDLWTTLFDITLNPKKIWHYRLDSHNQKVPDKYLNEKLEKSSLSEIESEIVEQKIDGNWTTPEYVSISIKKSNPIKEFFSKIFGKKN